MSMYHPSKYGVRPYQSSKHKGKKSVAQQQLLQEELKQQERRGEIQKAEEKLRSMSDPKYLQPTYFSLTEALTIVNAPDRDARRAKLQDSYNSVTEYLKEVVSGNYRMFTDSIGNFTNIFNNISTISENLGTLDSRLSQSEKFFSFNAGGLESRFKDLLLSETIERFIGTIKSLFKAKEMIQALEQSSLFFTSAKLINLASQELDRTPLKSLNLMKEANEFFAMEPQNLKSEILEQYLSFIFRRPQWNLPDYLPNEETSSIENDLDALHLFLFFLSHTPVGQKMNLPMDLSFPQLHILRSFTQALQMANSYAYIEGSTTTLNTCISFLSSQVETHISAQDLSFSRLAAQLDSPKKSGECNYLLSLMRALVELGNAPSTLAGMGPVLQNHITSSLAEILQLYCALMTMSSTALGAAPFAFSADETFSRHEMLLIMKDLTDTFQTLVSDKQAVILPGLRRMTHTDVIQRILKTVLSHCKTGRDRCSILYSLIFSHFTRTAILLNHSLIGFESLLTPNKRQGFHSNVRMEQYSGSLTVNLMGEFTLMVCTLCTQVFDEILMVPITTSLNTKLNQLKKFVSATFDSAYRKSLDLSATTFGSLQAKFGDPFALGLPDAPSNSDDVSDADDENDSLNGDALEDDDFFLDQEGAMPSGGGSLKSYRSTYTQRVSGLSGLFRLSSHSSGGSGQLEVAVPGGGPISFKHAVTKQHSNLKFVVSTWIRQLYKGSPKAFLIITRRIVTKSLPPFPVTEVIEATLPDISPVTANPDGKRSVMTRINARMSVRPSTGGIFQRMKLAKFAGVNSASPGSNDGEKTPLFTFHNATQPASTSLEICGMGRSPNLSSIDLNKSDTIKFNTLSRRRRAEDGHSVSQQQEMMPSGHIRTLRSKFGDNESEMSDDEISQYRVTPQSETTTNDHTRSKSTTTGDAIGKHQPNAIIAIRTILNNPDSVGFKFSSSNEAFKTSRMFSSRHLKQLSSTSSAVTHATTLASALFSKRPPPPKKGQKAHVSSLDDLSNRFMILSSPSNSLPLLAATNIFLSVTEHLQTSTDILYTTDDSSAQGKKELIGVVGIRDDLDDYTQTALPAYLRNSLQFHAETFIYSKDAFTGRGSRTAMAVEDVGEEHLIVRSSLGVIGMLTALCSLSSDCPVAFDSLKYSYRAVLKMFMNEVRSYAITPLGKNFSQRMKAMDKTKLTMMIREGNVEGEGKVIMDGFGNYGHRTCKPIDFRKMYTCALLVRSIGWMTRRLLSLPSIPASALRTLASTHFSRLDSSSIWSAPAFVLQPPLNVPLSVAGQQATAASIISGELDSAQTMARRRPESIQTKTGAFRLGGSQGLPVPVNPLIPQPSATQMIVSLLEMLTPDIEEMIQLQQELLTIIRVEIRFFILSQLHLANKQEDNFLEEDATVEPHKQVVSCVKTLMQYGEDLTPTILPDYADEIFGGLDDFICSYCITSTQNIQRINSKGLQKLRGNIYTLQQSLNTIYPQKFHNFDPAHKYYNKLALDLQ
ncbi:hypothetical protein BLNAU_11961 [Blattamonas nauphoetae]|uniref:Exocyst complex component Sec8 n=1 Tax=Blattamonas nauphoetae TaxID=2049346 RepID=A0ABQ9XPQ1_9EUKA|nr:hypothetical protein BLNAU_11961 [Blattamonas nauphoetae]